MIMLILTVLSAFGVLLKDRWVLAEQVQTNTIQVASVEDELRKARLTAWRWEVKGQTMIVESQMKDSTNPYFIRKLEDLKRQAQCLEEAMDIKGKYPAECMQ